jgi:hypothetical protein
MLKESPHYEPVACFVTMLKIGQALRESYKPSEELPRELLTLVEKINEQTEHTGTSAEGKKIGTITYSGNRISSNGLILRTAAQAPQPLTLTGRPSKPRALAAGLYFFAAAGGGVICPDRASCSAPIFDM